jgi:hypothetical protein
VSERDILQAAILQLKRRQKSLMALCKAKREQDLTEQNYAYYQALSSAILLLQGIRRRRK